MGGEVGGREGIYVAVGIGMFQRRTRGEPNVKLIWSSSEGLVTAHYRLNEVRFR